MSVSTNISILDHDNIGSNERCDFHASDQAVLTRADPNATFHVQRSCDDEVRVELDLAATLLTDGDVRVSGWAYLFEGTSWDTTELEGDEEIAGFVVRRGTSATKRVVVYSLHGDYGIIRFTIHNVAD